MKNVSAITWLMKTDDERFGCHVVLRKVGQGTVSFVASHF
jgi:hypothetical protein